MERQFMIVGAGMGMPEGLTEQARKALCEAGCVFAPERLTKGLSSVCDSITVGMSEMAERAIACGAQTVALVMSGDTGFFSLTNRIQQTLRPHGAVQIIPGLSSMQYLCAKCGIRYDDAYIFSLHGRSGNILGAVSYHKKVFVLTGGQHTAQSICQDLHNAGLSGVNVILGENLGSAEEQIIEGTAETLAGHPTGDLAVLLIRNESAADARQSLRDDRFTRGQVPMTKQEVRWAAVNLLDIHKQDIVYDIGAGTGSVSIELARHAERGLVYAIERKDAGLELIEYNRKALGAFNVVPVAGHAPEAFAGLPIPDAAFIGGSGGELPEILAWLKEKNPDIRVCVSAIAVETLATALESMKKLGYANLDVCQISAARGKKVASYTMMTANNPVFLLTGGGKPNEA